MFDTMALKEQHSRSSPGSAPPAKRQKQRQEQAPPGSGELDNALTKAKAAVAAALEKSVRTLEEKVQEISCECGGKQQWAGEDHSRAEQELAEKTDEIEREFQTEVQNAQDEYDYAMKDVVPREQKAQRALEAAKAGKKAAEKDGEDEDEDEDDPVAECEEALEELREEREEAQRQLDQAKEQAQTKRDQAVNDADCECSGKQQWAGEDHYKAIREAENAWDEAQSELEEWRMLDSPIGDALAVFEDAVQEALAEVEEGTAEQKAAMSRATEEAQAALDGAVASAREKYQEALNSATPDDWGDRDPPS